MAEISRFFNSIDHDRVYSAADWAAYFAKFIGNGVMPQPSSQLMVAAGDDTGLSLSVSPGSAFISGYGYENTAALPLTLSTADGSYSRIDRVVIRWSRSQRQMFAAVLTGTPAASPQPPALTRTADTYELSLAAVTVARGATEITQSAITDERGDATVCGFCTWMFSEAGANYDDFWAQFRAEFDEWLASVDDQLDPEQAAGIAARLAALTPVDIPLTFEAADWTYDSTNAVWNLLIPASDVTHEVEGVDVPYPVGDATEAFIDLDMSGATSSTAAGIETDWSLVGRVYVDAQGIHAVAYGDAPIGDIPVIVRLVDKE